MKKILILDDERRNIIWMKDDFEDLGYEVTITTSPKQAIKKVKRKYFDLIIADIVLEHEMSGIDFLKHIRKLEKQEKIPSMNVILITAKATKDFAIDAVNLGAEKFLLKGDENFDEELTNAVKSFLNNEDQIVKTIEEWVKSSPDPNKKVITAAGTSFSPTEILHHLRIGDELGLSLRRSLARLGFQYS